MLNYSVIFANIDHNLIKDIDKHLSQIDNVAIDFTQVDQNNKLSEGKLLIKKPYHFRCNYYPPYPLLIVGGKKYVLLYDYELETITRVNSHESITNILLVKSFKDNDDWKIIETKSIDGYLTIKVLYKNQDQISELFFDDQSFNLRKIKIFEMQKLSIVLNLSEPIKVKNFAKNLFQIPSPKIFGKPLFLNKEQLEKLYETY